GRIGFAHDYLRRAVESKYIKDAAIQREAHRKLAEYFEKQELSARQIDELPWQWAEAEDWDRMVGLMTDEPVFVGADKEEPSEVRQYWSRIEAGSRYRMVEAYGPLLDSADPAGSAVTSSAANKNFAWRVSVLMRATGHPREAEHLREHLSQYYRQTRDEANL